MIPLASIVNSRDGRSHIRTLLDTPFRKYRHIASLRLFLGEGHFEKLSCQGGKFIKWSKEFENHTHLCKKKFAPFKLTHPRSYACSKFRFLYDVNRDNRKSAFLGHAKECLSPTWMCDYSQKLNLEQIWKNEAKERKIRVSSVDLLQFTRFLFEYYDSRKFIKAYDNVSK